MFPDDFDPDGLTMAEIAEILTTMIGILPDRDIVVLWGLTLDALTHSIICGMYPDPISILN